MSVAVAFERAATAHGERVALEGEGSAWTYAELASRVARVAGALAARGVEPGDRVAACMPRGPDVVTAWLACAWLGAVWVPLDPSWPRVRRELAIRETAARLTLETLCEDAAPLLAPVPRAPEDLAYVMYTSGSSGAPKGVRVPHAGLLAVLDAQIAAFGLASGKRVLQVLSHVFDASLSDFGSALLSGATLIVDPGPLEPSRISAALERTRASHVDLPPALLIRLSPERLPRTLETVIVGGEPTPASVLRAWARKVQVVVCYGPTETTICSSLLRVDAERWTCTEIGAPIAGARYHLQDGELLIGGPGVALGYVHRPELEAQRFFEQGGERLYRTGDRVRALGADRYELLGRVDRQLKLRGVLVAPEEIEAVLAAEAAEAAVLLRDGRLTAFVVGMSPAAARARVRAHLPRALWPQHVEAIPALPRTSTAKVDYAALAAWSLTTTSELVAARGDVEQQLVEVFRAALGPGAAVGRDSDFVTLGGDSLAALEIVAGAEARGLAVTSEALYGGDCIAVLARGAEPAPVPTSQLRDDVARELRRLPAPSEQPMRPGALLLTGATGFLGAHVGAELLDRGVSVIAVVRARDAAHARARLEAAWAEHDLAPDAASLEVLAGDLTQQRFGLDAATWSRIAHEVSEVAHLAADVNLVLPYARLYGANLRATTHVLELVRSGTFKMLHYASTLSVGACAAPITPVLYEEELPAAEHVFGGYAASKWAAEYLVQRAAVDVRTVRLGLLTAKATAVRARPSCQLQAFVRGLGVLGGYPDGASSLAFDVTPVDYAAQAFVALRDAPAGVWHLANPQPARFGALQAALAAHGLSLPRIDAAELRARVASSPLDRGLAVSALSACRRLLDAGARHTMSDLFLATDQRFDLERSAPYLAARGLSCPPADAALLQKYVQHALGPEGR